MDSVVAAHRERRECNAWLAVAPRLACALEVGAERLDDRVGAQVDREALLRLETEGLALSVPDTAGGYLVPAFVGLGAPHWDSEARALLTDWARPLP